MAPARALLLPLLAALSAAERPSSATSRGTHVPKAMSLPPARATPLAARAARERAGVTVPRQRPGLAKGPTALALSSRRSTRELSAIVPRAQGDSQASSTDQSVLPAWLPLFVVPALGGSLFGYDIGATSSVVRLLGTGSSDLGSLDSLQLGLVASLPLLGAVVASALLIGIGDKNIGRKTEMYVASVLYGAGTLVQSLSGDLNPVLFGRLIYGLGIGIAMHAAPLYIAETTPTELRGKLVSLKEAAIVLGIVGGYAAGAAFNSDAPDAWRLVFQVALPLEAAMLALNALLLPESPRWLALRGLRDKAVLALMRGQRLDMDEAQSQVNQMMELSGSDGAAEDDLDFVERTKLLVSDPLNRKALQIGVGLVLLQQLSGQPSVLYYANRIFEKAGLGFEAAVGVGVFKTIMTLVSVGLVENPKWGRRPLLLTGTAGMAASLGALSAIFALAGGEEPSSTAVLACVVAFVGFYQIGFGPVTWLILSEIFPLKTRSAALSIGTLSNFASNFLVSALFEFERERVGESALFAQFAIIAAFAVWFETSQVPETRGLSLEQIEEKLKENL
mmetsp:Transcript_30768/g.60205  ORF Transcript_30768/g.60205 Transcript_30768/m.60205 type:complete len:563 (-) Transcript_30768:212-1900(-)